MKSTRSCRVKPIVLAILFAARLPAQVWTALPDFPGDPRDDGASALVNSHAFFGTGLRQDFSATNDWYDLDLETLTWSSVPSMPAGTERQYACAFAGINSFYVFGGDGGGALNDLYRFDLQTKQWTKKAPRPSKGVIACACAVVAGKAVVYGGKVNHDSLPTPEVWEYNMSNDTWTRKENAPFGGRWRSAMASLGALIYVAGGAALPGGSIRRDLWSYDPGTGEWDSLAPAPVPIPVNYAALQAVGNKLVYFGGQDSLNAFSKDVWYYRVLQGDWQAGPPLPADGRKGGMSLGWNEKFIYTCGLAESFVRVNDSWILDLPLSTEETGVLHLSMGPNPFEDALRIDFPSPGNYIYSLVADDGREFARGEITARFAELALPGLAPGVYYLHISEKSNVRIVKKLIRR